MKFKFLFLIFVFIQTMNSFACLDAKQHKIFPVGVFDNQIFSIDAHIHRTESRLERQNNEKKFPETMWIIKSYVSIYDKNQNLISKERIEETQVINESYFNELQSIYIKGIRKISLDYKNIEYFVTEYISFCDFQKSCDVLKIEYDTINKKDFLIYKTKKYSINLDEYKTYYKSDLFTGNLSAYYLSSIRIFKTKELKLVIGHLETGHEISMGWITSDPNKKPKDDNVIVANEHKPKIAFDKLETSVYKEPLLHHGYGFDFFIVVK